MATALQRLREAVALAAPHPAVRAHLADARWAEAVPIDLAEIPGLTLDPEWQWSLPRALEATAQRDAQALVPAVIELATRAAALRKEITDTLHVLQLQTLERVRLALPSLAGRAVLDIGCGNGGLFHALRGAGATVTGIDLERQFEDPALLRGDALTATLPLGRFAAVTACAVFESGSRLDGERIDAPQGALLLARLHELLAPGGIAALETLSSPLPFSKGQAEQAGFAVKAQLVPGCNVRFSGRGCTLEKR